MESAVSDTTLTFRVDSTLKNEFSSAVKGKDRSAAQLLRDFMREVVKQQKEASSHDAWMRREVQAGIDAANAGETVTAEEVEADAKAWRAKIANQTPGADA
jgi:predicted transcriptional regulator